MLGGKAIRCKDCNHVHYLYFSCGNSRCMICQSIKREQWLDKLQSKLLDVPYVHLVTTMPHRLNKLAKRYPRQMYNLIFQTTKATIWSIYENEAHVGAKPGMISVLHTWGSDMKYHVHVHSLLSFGGINKKGEWVYPKHKKRICRNRKLRFTYKNLFLEGLEKLLSDPQIEWSETFEEIEADLKDKQWNVRIDHPSMKSEAIETYLARYVNRIAVTNNRLEFVKSTEQVNLLYNDYKNQKDGEIAPKEVKSMHPLVFINQLLLHLPPPYFQRQRRYGIHANKVSKEVKALIVKKLRNNGQTIRKVFEILTQMLKRQPFVCEQCGSEAIEIKEVAPDQQWIFQYITLPQIRAPSNNISAWKNITNTVNG